MTVTEKSYAELADLHLTYKTTHDDSRHAYVRTVVCSRCSGYPDSDAVEHPLAECVEVLHARLTEIENRLDNHSL